MPTGILSKIRQCLSFISLHIAGVAHLKKRVTATLTRICLVVYFRDFQIRGQSSPFGDDTARQLRVLGRP